MLSIRVAPYLKFHIDEGLKKEIAILDLLHKVSQENEELDRKRAAEAAAADGEGDGSNGSDDGRAGADAAASSAASAGEDASPVTVDPSHRQHDAHAEQHQQQQGDTPAH
jgi:hypothetical protein